MAKRASTPVMDSKTPESRSKFLVRTKSITAREGSKAMTLISSGPFSLKTKLTSKDARVRRQVDDSRHRENSEPDRDDGTKDAADTAGPQALKREEDEEDDDGDGDDGVLDGWSGDGDTEDGRDDGDGLRSG